MFHAHADGFGVEPNRCHRARRYREDLRGVAPSTVRHRSRRSAPGRRTHPRRPRPVAANGAADTGANRAHALHQAGKSTRISADACAILLGITHPGVETRREDRFHGRQPTFRQSLPSRLRSISATFAQRRRGARRQLSRAAPTTTKVVPVGRLRIAPSGRSHVASRSRRARPAMDEDGRYAPASMQSL